MRIIGYAHDADISCPRCLKMGLPSWLLTTETMRDRDEHGVPMNLTSANDNPAHPVFDTDEQLENLYCGDCHELLKDVPANELKPTPFTVADCIYVLSKVRASFGERFSSVCCSIPTHSLQLVVDVEFNHKGVSYMHGVKTGANVDNDLNAIAGYIADVLLYWRNHVIATHQGDEDA